MNTFLLRRRVRRSSALLLGLCCSLGLAGFACGQRVALNMRPAALPSDAVDQGPLPQSASTTVTLYLQPSSERVAALGQYLIALQTPGNAAYKAWLTPAQFGEQFGATADQIKRVSEWAQANGLAASASPSGLSISLGGTVAQVEAALAPGLHTVQWNGMAYVANTATPAIAQSLAADVVAAGGLSTLPGTHPITLTSVAGTEIAVDVLASVGAAVGANTSRVLSLDGTACVEDIDAASQTAMRLLLGQANAQGITILASSGCGSRGSAGFPAAFSEVTAAAPAGGINVPAHPTLSEARPEWQNAPGLPEDLFRHEPDFAVSSLDALASTVAVILKKIPAAADGTPVRLGNMNTALYAMASEKGLYTQPDGAAAGTWEAETGLGVVDLDKLAKAYATGTLSTDVSLTISNYSPTHGSSVTFTSHVKDTSGQGGGAVPTGTVVFTIAGAATITSPPQTLDSNGTATYTTAALPGGQYTVTSQYSGDGKYAAAPGDTSDNLQVLAEAANISGGGAALVPLGGTITLVINIKAPSGVGTPTNNVTVQPTGTPDTNTYTAKLSGSGGTATATVMVPAVQAGTDTFVVRCDTADPSFTCNQQNVTANVTKATPEIILTVSPNPPVSGQNVDLKATVVAAGNGATAPGGTVSFYNNNQYIQPQTVTGGIAEINTANFYYSSSGNTFTISYGGDNNYNSTTTSVLTPGQVATTTVASASVTSVPVGGSTQLIATIMPATTSTFAMSGTVTFSNGGATVFCTATQVANGVASCTATFNSRGVSGIIVATYSGDANFGGSSSTNNLQVTTVQGATTTTLSASPTMPVAGQATVFSATVAASTGSAATVGITGNVVFYINGTAYPGSGLANGVSTFSTTLANGSQSVYAVYSGDANFTGSTSATAIYSVGTGSSSSSGSASTIVVTISPTSAVAGSNITLQATITGASGSASSAPLYGQVTFFDLYNGQTTQIGNPVSVSSTSGALGIAQTSTNALLQGTHQITAVYSGNSNYASETSAAVSITLGDYSIVFAPASLTLSAGSSGSATATITALSNFTGTVSLTCTPPSLVYITCSFNPTTVTGAGTSTLTVTTQVQHAEARPLMLRGLTGGVAFAALVFGCLAPRRRKLAVALMVLLGAGLLGTVGCTNLVNAGTSSPLGNGTPIGSYNLTISSSGTYQGATVTHSQQFKVTVQ